MKFLALFILLYFYTFKLALPVRAACWCADPVADNCQCGKTGTSPYGYDYSYTYSPSAGKFGATPITKTIKLYCDTAEETRSEFAVKAPICGSSPEILPYCAQETADPSRYSCYGREFAKGDTDPAIKSAPDKSWVQVTGTFTYNGASFGPANNVFVCDSGAFGCARGDATFIDPDIPNPNDANFYCTPQRTGVNNPPFCGLNAIGSGESRLFFPHLRNISALSTLLQSIFNPGPDIFKKNVEPVPAGKTASSSLDSPETVTSKIYFHQGKDDDTQVVSGDKNNSSLRVGQPAPAPLYNFDGSDNPYKTSGFCSIDETKVNPGDDLLGPKITARLTYTQKYQYKVAPSLNCFGDNAYVSEDERKNCCSFKAAGIESSQDGLFLGTREKRYVCGTLPGHREKTKGRIAVFTKSPLIEYVYDTLVVGSQSVLKRIFPQGNPKEFKEIPSETKYIATAPGADEMAVGGKTGQTPTIYIPHLGSLYEYFLQGLQKALRPLGAFNRSPDVFTQSPSGDCNTVAEATTSAPACPASVGSAKLSSPCGINTEMQKIINDAGNAFNIPPAIIAGILSIETRNGVFGVSKEEVARIPYLCQPNSCGAMGAMQLLTGYGVQASCPQAIGINRWGEFACDSGSGKPNPGNLRDSIFAGAKMISSFGISHGNTWTQDQVLEVGYRYFGSKTQTFNLRANIDYANSCLSDSEKPNIFENEMTYGDYLWYYYSPRK